MLYERNTTAETLVINVKKRKDRKKNEKKRKKNVELCENVSIEPWPLYIKNRMYDKNSAVFLSCETNFSCTAFRGRKSVSCWFFSCLLDHDKRDDERTQFGTSAVAESN